MREEPRFLIGNHIYRIDTIFGNISQAGNADNQIPVAELYANKHSYNLSIDSRSGKLLSEAQDESIKVSIPKSIVEDGYEECTKFAENFNTQLSNATGIMLVDETVLKNMAEISMPLPVQVFPIIEKDGFRFEIDASLREIRSVDKPFNHIDLDRLQEEKGKYVVYISKEGNLSSWDQGNSLKLEIDQLVRIAPDDVSRIYGIAKNQLPAEDRQLRTNPAYISDRIEKGKLPIIRIVDEDYYVDTRLRELRSTNKFWKTIELIDNGPEAYELDNKHVYLYDYLNRQIIKDFNELTDIPKHTQFIVLPDFQSMDPVAAGRSLCNHPFIFLDKYPLQVRMEARLVPIEKTYLAERIQYNKEKKQLEKNNKVKLNSEKEKVIKPAAKNNRNKGLSF